jgi:hypothetical protein
VIDEKDAVEVIDFMLDRASEHPIGLDLLLNPFGVEEVTGDPLMSAHFSEHYLALLIDYRQAAFILYLGSP